MSERRAPYRTRRKYGNRVVLVDGYRFDSLLEARRYEQLRQLQLAGEIRDLAVHPPFELEVNGQHICSYRADFSYYTKEGVFVVEDVKSQPTRTPVYQLKKRLMRVLKGIALTEITEA